MNRTLPLSLLAIVAAVSSVIGRAADGSDVLRGRIEKHVEFAAHGVAPREIDVWLPPGYDATKERYPVVYLQDGQNLFDPKTSYTGVPWGIDRTLERLVAQRDCAPAILVGIWNTKDRFLEYMPQKAVRGMVATRIPGFDVAVPADALKSDAYLTFLVSELKPFIDRHYRTRTGPANTFIMGSSMGGLISAYAMVEYPKVFGGAACLSTHWPAGDGAVVGFLAAHLPRSGAHRLYFDYGTETLDAAYEPHQRRMDAAMRRLGYVEGRDWQTRKFEGADHSEKSWAARVEVPLKFLLRE